MKKSYLKLIIENKYWIAAVVSIGIVVLIPLLLSLRAVKQTFDIKGIYIKNDSRLVDRFISGIKSDNGVLILGTSETGNDLGGLNYWGFLNKDLEGKYYYSVLAGAGRTCGMYFPLLLENKELFKDLKVLLYINPTYWRKGLNNFRSDYYERYVGSYLFTSAIDEAKKVGVYEKFMSPATFDGLPGDTVNSISLAETASHYYEDFRSYYYYDLMDFLNGSKKIEKQNGFLLDTITDKQMSELTVGIDMEFNGLSSWLPNSSAFPEIDVASTFQYEQLFAFINLCKELEIDVTYYLGPYNQVFCIKRSPELISQYEEVLQNIRAIISYSDVPFIDGSNQSYIPGTFLDVQHTSQYGALLTALQIKKHYEVEENLN